MASPSKKDNVLKLILENSPLKEWHFEEVVSEARVTKAVASKWLKRFVDEGLLKRVKKKGKFPYFTVGSDNPVYYSWKRVYAFEVLHQSGLISKLLSLKSARTVIIFGSVVKGDWYKDSDLDLFILGDISGFNKGFYERRIGRHIELHIFKDKKEVKEVRSGLIHNIANGYIFKGKVQDIMKVAL